MKINRTKLITIIVLVAVIILAITLAVAYGLYQSGNNSGSKAYNPVVLMAVTSAGGNCVKECEHPVYNLYDSGKFEGYKALSNAELSELKNVIDTTDFQKYQPNPEPRCQSFADGRDQVLMFPQKYGEKKFTACKLDIPTNDPAFNPINKILKEHFIERN